jgi:hypothetical protein
LSSSGGHPPAFKSTTTSKAALEVKRGCGNRFGGSCSSHQDNTIRQVHSFVSRAEHSGIRLVTSPADDDDDDVGRTTTQRNYSAPWNSLPCAIAKRQTSH